MCRRRTILDRSLGFFGLRRLTSNDKRFKEGYNETKTESEPPIDKNMGFWHKLLAGLGLVTAHWPPPQNDNFYGLKSTPATLDNRKPGDVLRWRNIEVTPFPGIDASQLKAYQIAFVTTDGDGLTDTYGSSGRLQTAVTTVMVPPNATFDKVLSMQPKTDGAAPICRTSYSLRKGTETRFASLSESLFLPPFFDEGWVVSMPDLGGQYDSFGDAMTSGRVTLDNIKAMINLRDTIGIKNDAKFGLWGYSAGAQATFWAAQLQEKYAPELDDRIVGFAGGGLPANLTACAQRLNNGFAAGLIVGMVGGLSNAYPDFDKTVNKYLTPKGHKLYDIAHEKCWAEYMLASFEKDVLAGPPDGYFNITNPLDQPDVNSILAKSNLLTVAAKSAPRQPMWLTGSLEDEAVPPDQMQTIVDLWSKNGATIQLTKDRTPGHAVNCFSSFPATVRWLRDRFANKPNPAKPGKPVVQTVVNSLELLLSSEAKEDVKEDSLKRLKAAGDLFSIGEKKPPWWF